jgi:hypothetical protein
MLKPTRQAWANENIQQPDLPGLLYGDGFQYLGEWTGSAAA